MVTIRPMRKTAKQSVFGKSGKKTNAFSLPKEMLAAVDKIRGDVPRNPWLRDLVEDYLASGEEAPNFRLPRKVDKVTWAFEISRDMADQLKARCDLMAQDREYPPRTGTLLRMIIYGHLRKLGAQAAAREFLDARAKRRRRPRRVKPRAAATAIYPEGDLSAAGGIGHLPLPAEQALSHPL